MCRSIQVLRRPDQPVTPEEVNAAALQFVRKISGFRRPSQANQAVFEAAVAEIATASERLLRGLAGGRAAATLRPLAPRYSTSPKPEG